MITSDYNRVYDRQNEEMEYLKGISGMYSEYTRIKIPLFELPSTVASVQYYVHNNHLVVMIHLEWYFLRSALRVIPKQK
jgi:hypothetical protein